jgi:HK97 family phage portal protein
MLLEEGLSFEKVTMTSEEAQFIESRKFQRSDIGMFFGVPPHMFGDIERGTSWGSGIEQQGVGFVTYTLLPWLTNIEQGMGLALLNPEERNRLAPNFDTEPLTRADILARSQAHKIWFEAGVLSPDEWRRREGMGPRPDGRGGVFSTGSTQRQAA